ncbi:MAG: RsmB/NOP family class I SAM-dependent RNA methyltransferase, partial [Staphylothermus sp.]|nr:RsmB/NOP family class I SAM-dependent RNA methyltransferase [Staphylothermus sp.]
PAVKINTSRISKLEHYHEIQYRILKNTLKHAKMVVYSTCSIHSMEGEEVIKRIVEENLAEPIKIYLPKLATGYKGYSFSKRVYRTQPHIINGQGFFIAVLESKTVKKL